jgi:hypothetical protein
MPPLRTLRTVAPVATMLSRSHADGIVRHRCRHARAGSLAAARERRATVVRLRHSCDPLPHVRRRHACGRRRMVTVRIAITIGAVYGCARRHENSSSTRRRIAPFRCRPRDRYRTRAARRTAPTNSHRLRLPRETPPRGRLPVDADCGHAVSSERVVQEWWTTRLKPEKKPDQGHSDMTSVVLGERTDRRDSNGPEGARSRGTPTPAADQPTPRVDVVAVHRATLMTSARVLSVLRFGRTRHPRGMVRYYLALAAGALRASSRDQRAR